ncbi:MAG: tetratricopeptide repeat protein [Planctomycetaceae bacterium]
MLAIGVAVVALAWRPLAANLLELRANAALARRDFDTASALLQDLVSRAPSGRVTFQLARALRRKGDLFGADAALRRAAQAGWDSTQISTQRLLAEAQCGDVVDVERPIERLIGSGPPDQTAEECYEALAQGYLNALWPEKAAKCLEFWAAWQPANPLVHYWKGRMHEEAEEWPTALEHYRAALELAPWRYDTLQAVARMEQETARLEDASEHYARCHAQRPDEPASALGLADCMLKRGAPDQAKPMLLEALTLDLSDEVQAAVITNLAEIALEAGDLDDARALAAQAVALDQRSPRCRLVHAAILARLGESEGAESERKRGQHLGHRQVALAEAARRARVNPHDPDVRAEVGGMMLELGLEQEAARWYEIALQIDPQHRPSHEALAAYWSRVGDQARAARHRRASTPAPAAE